MKYVLITPARNEEKYIENTIQSVVNQTFLPKEWIIVDDRSYDNTSQVVNKYVNKYPFIKLINIKEKGSSSFAAKAKAIKIGIKNIRNVSYDLIGNIDADVTFDSNYFEYLIEKFCSNNKLGIAGGKIHELIGNKFVEQNISLNSVAGAVQLFRRECFEGIGGYKELRYGGIDAAAEIMARANNWEVKTYKELKVYHHRRVKTGNKNVMLNRFKHGINHYMLGYHPLFQILRVIGKLKDKPYVIGSLMLISGYFWGHLKKYNRIMPKETIEFLQTEQKKRIIDMIK